jgi:hypothetical protein
MDWVCDRKCEAGNTIEIIWGRNIRISHLENVGEAKWLKLAQDHRKCWALLLLWGLMLLRWWLWWVSSRTSRRIVWYKFNDFSEEMCCPYLRVGEFADQANMLFWRFGGSYCLHLQDQRVSGTNKCVAWCLLVLRFDPEYGEDMPVRNVGELQTTRHHIPDDSVLHILLLFY